MANLKIELSKLDSEAWPGALDVEKEKLMLINEKEELLKELQFVTPQKRTQDELERLEAERQRLEEELLLVRGAPSRALAQRFVPALGTRLVKPCGCGLAVPGGQFPWSVEISVASQRTENQHRGLPLTLLVSLSVRSSVCVRNVEMLGQMLSN